MLLRAFLLVSTIRLGLWLLPFRTIRRLVAKAAANPSSPKILTGPIEAPIAAIQLVSRRIPGATCLTQAFAAQILLHRAGHTPLLRIGVLTKARQLKAHAWVECEGKIVLGQIHGLEEFRPLPDLSAMPHFS